MLEAKSEIAYALVYSAPMLLVCALAALLAVTSQSLPRRAMLLILCGAGLELAATLLGPAAMRLAIQTAGEMWDDGRTGRSVILGFSFVLSMVHAVAFGIILTAVIVDRTPQIEPCAD